jgi:hypothetical protein
MSLLPLTPTLSPHAGRGRIKPLAPRERGEGWARPRATMRSGRSDVARDGRDQTKPGGCGRVRSWLWRFGGSGLTLCAVIISLALSGCGKKNAPQPPPDVPNTYPRPYPSE